MSFDLSVIPHKNIILAVTGGIAAYKSAILVRRLKDYGFDVRVVMTQGAQAFITPLTFQALSGNPVHTELLDPEAEAGMGHIELARWADLILVAPASCDSIAKFANGLADDLLSTLYLASKAPVWVAPAMNQQMWAAKATQRNLQTLVEDGVHVIMPDAGEQACGDVGLGRMPEPEDLARQVAAYFHKAQRAIAEKFGLLAGKRVTITAGPTREAIDPVRYISNHSTGKMGFALAAACYAAGAKVTLVAGPVSLDTPNGVQRINVSSAMQMLDVSMNQLQQGCDIFIATAAVADYRVAQVAEHKIKKAGDELAVSLVKNPDIVATIAQQQQRPFMVGFAAETQNVEEYAAGKLVAKKLDMIACNDVSRPDIGFASDENAMTVFFAQSYHMNKRELEKASKQEISQQLVESIADALRRRL
ncbi:MULTISPECIES: bifunctional phosphopantothenoylcysteine decarboxylase/phosphopantothenate--cysteine ligase CoaBC [unclassified Acinetobacter]|uniref:bifunctional phosphopantothenoylcysteine decarboxylase/phosphopantothenate--cysteine ligase CoaBC n=1 Tax=unclassified Acinetobacter TaxID=196816 RepID=UPI00244AF531|nr:MULTISPECIES: bifunctional phosphopantothenoylcysteine decarboxylase/phosphopantothenate--cysteine ligase CoaBC [unclassified Acinetobacter]MDH0032620.1 bifunctional phosphopantothenoylcysteine decarboxylase/phosphopantothenate--cysteine ligase CoaBC [Acinetobacter sp. GD04021]MDH0886928.1 bifunctional phosphopantothenoylcysteine decarboxylase/phosphopantothenate--cysteine ligase CoaBC [Acinetobacter sp. GD03873]MDH1083259.1 bifunctional phosphopantothenoylcysteine decarboxylase/phosphopantot